MVFITRCAREYGDVIHFRFMGVPVIIVVHPKDIEDILVTNYQNFVKSKDYRALKGLLGDGLLTSEGKLWQRHRKLVQPSFRHEHIDLYGRVMVDYTRRAVEAWQDGEVRDAHQDMMKLTLEIVSRCLFDVDASEAAREVGEALEVVMSRFNRVAQMAFLMPEGWPIPTGPRYRRAVRRLDKIIYNIIHARRASAKHSTDLLSMLIETSEVDESAFSDREVRDEVMTLFLAGHETTAIALSWTWYLLAQHPEIESRLARELEDVLDGRAPTVEDLPQLRFTEMIVKEALRLYPPAWGVGRQAVNDFDIGGYHLPAGTNVFLSQWITHRDPRFFKEPDRFDPDRWKNDPVRSGEIPRFAYFPFGGGPRVCVGAAFAMMEARLILATIAQHCRLELVTGCEVKPQPSVTLRPKNGVRVTVRTRP